jgi:hypothetical protein
VKKSVLGLGLTALTAFTLIAGAGAANAAPVPTTAPYTATSSDGGTCGNEWAVDLYNRVFTLPKADPAGNFAVIEKFTQGHFSTTAGQSPGACNNGQADNGSTIKEGVSGSFYGSEHIFVQGSTAYVAGNGSCNGFLSSDPLNPCTNTSYFAYHYPGSTLTITAYTFTYNSTKAAAVKKWVEVGDSSSEVDTGDIASAILP